jgi:ACS family hexuronate transporter-like MFS transporter
MVTSTPLLVRTHLRWWICLLVFLATTINYLDRQILSSERAFATVLFNSGTNAGAILAPAFVPWLMLTWSWHAPFIVAAAAGFIWLAVWCIFYAPPQKSRGVSPGELAWIERDRDLRPETAPIIPWRSLFGYRQAWSFIVAKFLTDPVWFFLLIWLPDYFKKARGLDLRNSWPHLVTIYAIITALSLCGGWATGRLVSRGWSVTRTRKTGLLAFALLVLPILLVTEAGDWIAVCLIGLAGAQAGYHLLFGYCSCAYLIALVFNHLLAPSFEPVVLKTNHEVTRAQSRLK